PSQKRDGRATEHDGAADRRAGAVQRGGHEQDESGQPRAGDEGAGGVVLGASPRHCQIAGASPAGVEAERHRASSGHGPDAADRVRGPTRGSPRRARVCGTDRGVGRTDGPERSHGNEETEGAERAGEEGCRCHGCISRSERRRGGVGRPSRERPQKPRRNQPQAAVRTNWPTGVEYGARYEGWRANIAAAAAAVTAPIALAVVRSPARLASAARRRAARCRVVWARAPSRSASSRTSLVAARIKAAATRSAIGSPTSSAKVRSAVGSAPRTLRARRASTAGRIAAGESGAVTAIASWTPRPDETASRSISVQAATASIRARSLTTS